MVKARIKLFCTFAFLSVTFINEVYLLIERNSALNYAIKTNEQDRKTGNEAQFAVAVTPPTVGVAAVAA